ncbi:ABC transporter permease [Streptomyces phyllanthi]|uniref:ABC transporter permease n=1 Tax=Streptomyces phyllanthi TaxID=1803180 RepID=A0A5N8W5V5_9ACTN|nr:ABC transporter permease [Streptomyces phyllanthi]MPY42719.1 ABC transporter permease [Streptomyces phyllanthi]
MAIRPAIGAVGVANTTRVGVQERTAEIGLRRAPWVRGHVTGKFLTGSATPGVPGGLVRGLVGGL